ncbi:transcription initiation factor TFIID subunit 7 [Lingula anatina]|uniref:Transcription initiation factor TFIID subunit 7 n=1 Tax=Lingula anatina TaxID=7574 RepID=A0A1S3J5W1_LINAN|nr:transcription initiation factor TFIID subunit 7 [Lingula anatina]|eukprot:XP_013405693.1 transcription initiation factor TFIID subunit 7 [Lingula anatina]
MSGKTSTKKKEDAPFDLEQHFILRMPPGPAMALRRDIQSGSMALKDKLFIDFHPDSRLGQVRYGGDVFNAKLVDLPTITETLKTTDRKTFYKCADICQLMIATTEDEPEPEMPELSKKKEEKKYMWNHGLTPSLKNARKKRFRKILKRKNVEEWPDIEKEVKRLFRTDNEAVDVKWEVVTEEEEEDKQVVTESGQTQGAGGSVGAGLSQERKLQLATHDIFGEVSSSDEEEDEKEVNIMDVDEDSNSQFMPNLSGRSSSMMHSMDEDSMQGGLSQLTSTLQEDTMDLENKLSDLGMELSELRQQRESYEEQLEEIDNADVRERIQSALEDLQQQENRKQEEYNILASMLGKT